MSIANFFYTNHFCGWIFIFETKITDFPCNCQVFNDTEEVLSVWSVVSHPDVTKTCQIIVIPCQKMEHQDHSLPPIYWKKQARTDIFSNLSPRPNFSFNCGLCWFETQLIQSPTWQVWRRHDRTNFKQQMLLVYTNRHHTPTPESLIGPKIYLSIVCRLTLV